MRLNREQLLEIKKLDLSSKLSVMSESEYNNYCALLDEFIENFPILEAELKSIFKTDNLSYFNSKLSALKKILSVIYASEFVKECDELSENLKNTNRDMSEACLVYFLTSVSMLSIEIQMAKHKSENETCEEISVPPPPVPQPDAEFENSKKSILAVDDVSFLLNTLRGLLQGTEYKLTGVTSGEAALRFIQNHEVDLFILDIEMPGMNGYELAAKLKEMGQTAPVIFLTGNAQSKYVIKAMQMGAADFIVKPVNREQVLEKIKKHIG